MQFPPFFTHLSLLRVEAQLQKSNEPNLQLTDQRRPGAGPGAAPDFRSLFIPQGVRAPQGWAREARPGRGWGCSRRASPSGNRADRRLPAPHRPQAEPFPTRERPVWEGGRGGESRTGHGLPPPGTGLPLGSKGLPGGGVSTADVTGGRGRGRDGHTWECLLH